jgi:phosphatidylserine/phosphatidylglycerophosphate/cardiolipin synthase-like enzyme
MPGIASSLPVRVPTLRLRFWLLWAALVQCLSACAQLPPLPPRTATEAYADWRHSALEQRVLQVQPGHGLSGLRIVVPGNDALATLMTLADQAQHTLDLQYYIVHNDPSTRALMQHVLAAAERGVRVRMLVDDMNTAGNDQALRRLAEHRNIEVRIYNPLPGGRFSTPTKVLSSLTDFDRINRRMHNKMFVADNALAFAGGRNLGDAYFLQSGDANFVDMDVAVAGPAVRSLSRSFDRYWNSPLAYPVQVLVPKLSDAPPPGGRELDAAPTAPPALQLAPDAVARQLMPGGTMQLQWAPVRLLADDPAKIESLGEVGPDDKMFDDVASLMKSARREVTIISAYLVPGQRGMALFHELRSRGVRVRVLTSSLAATDAPAVYLGYARYRIPMLKEGVELYELRPRIDEHEHRELGGFGQSQARLHAKAMAVDGQYLLIGSMNLDPRSINLNSEIGLLAHSAPLAAQVDQLFDAVTRDSSFQLRLGTGGTLEWVRRLPDGGEDLRFTEPDSSWLKRLGWSLLAPLAPEEML